MIGTVQAVMIAQMPATTLRDAVLSHPTMVEGFNALFAAPETKRAAADQANDGAEVRSFRI
jgi:hypothetical protein